MRILIVDDEEKTVRYLRKGFTENLFVVDVACSGLEGLQRAESVAYDLIILEAVLPELNGLEIIQSLRSRGKQTPIIILTARDAVEDRIKGLELGADDCLTKPCAFSELLARVHTILRRGTARQPSRLRVAELELDPQAFRSSRAGRRLDLTPKEFALLSLLMRRSGEVLSRTRIAEGIWNFDSVRNTNVVDVHIRRLRSKVDEPFGKRLIHTVRGVGYVLEER